MSIDNGALPLNVIVGILEIPFFLTLLILGLAAYFRNKNIAVKYAIILFPAIMILNLLVLLLGIIFNSSYWNDSLSQLADTSNIILTFIVFILCLAIFIIGIRWYVKNKYILILCLVISFGLYAVSDFLIFINDYSLNYKYIAVSISALIIGLVAYLVGISAMIIALVRPKPRLADGGV